MQVMTNISATMIRSQQITSNSPKEVPESSPILAITDFGLSSGTKDTVEFKELPVNVRLS